MCLQHRDTGVLSPLQVSIRSPSFYGPHAQRPSESTVAARPSSLSPTTFTGLRRLFGDKLKSRHLRISRRLGDRASTKSPVSSQSSSFIPPRCTSCHAAASRPGPDVAPTSCRRFSVPYHIILTRVRQGFIHATRRGKRRLVVSSAEVERLSAPSASASLHQSTPGLTALRRRASVRLRTAFCAFPAFCYRTPAGYGLAKYIIRAIPA